jgi:hypothetical protein
MRPVACRALDVGGRSVVSAGVLARNFLHGTNGTTPLQKAVQVLRLLIVCAIHFFLNQLDKFFLCSFE